MAQFPSLVPSQAPITPGNWPMATHRAMDGGRTNVRTGSVEIGRAWAPTFENITEADYLAILGHYRAHRTRFDRFDFGTTSLAAALTPSGYSWRWAEAPQVVDEHADVFAVSCSFVCVPRQMPVIARKAWRTGATTLARGAWAPNLGALEVGVQFASAVTTLARGAWFGARAFLDGIPWVSSATTLARGAWSGADLDPNFSSVSLLLHMDGSNGSTTFTDSSSNAHAMSVNDGSVTITTAQSKFGGAAGEFAGDLRTPTSSTFTLNGDFTIELWARRTGTTGSFDTLVSASSENLLIRASSSNPGFNFNGTQFATGLALTLNTWQHVAMVRSGSTVTAYLDGVSIGTTTSSATLTCNFLIFGDSAVSGRYFKGQIDEVRVTKGVARYTSAFTPQSAAFPDA